MREIKFRCWDIKKKFLIYPDSCEHDIINGCLIIGETLEYGTHDEFNHFDLMQYTGLKDKNGKEIYEGDIVNAIANKDYPHTSVVSDVIFSQDYQWQVRSIIEGIEHEGVTHGLPINWGAWESLEVIGNIYENPDLLNREQNVQASVATVV